MTTGVTAGTPILSVLVGTYNRLDQLRACLDSIRTQTSVACDIWVTDAGSNDGTEAFLRAAAGPCLHPVFEGERVGQARALNSLLPNLRTPYVCWLSDDNIVVDGGLDVAVGILESCPTIGMVGLKVRDLRGPFADAPYIGGITATGVLNVNQGVLRTPLMQSLGGFSEEFRDYGIDADLTTRVLLAGHQVAYTRKVAVHHQRNWPEDGTPEARRLHDRNQRYKDLYGRTFLPRMGRGVGWMLRRGLWKALRLTVLRRRPINHPAPLLGFLMRDWHNMATGRFISPLREMTLRHRPYHLLQIPPARSP